MKILDVGCGSDKFKGNPGDTVIGLDKVAQASVDVVFDLEDGKPLPFKDGEFDVVVARMMLENLRDRDVLRQVVPEMCRVCKLDGTVKIWVPHYTSLNAFSSPEHTLFFCYTSFDSRYYGEAFVVKKRRFTYSPFLFPLSWFANAFPKLYEKFFVFWFPVGSLYCELKPTHMGGAIAPWKVEEHEVEPK